MLEWARGEGHGVLGRRNCRSKERKEAGRVQMEGHRELRLAWEN